MRMQRHVALLVWVATCSHALVVSANTFVRMDFNVPMETRQRSSVFIELFDDRPLTRNNFLNYVNSGKYNGTFMHRLANDFVLQGGGFYPDVVAEPAPLDVGINVDPVDLDGNPATANPTVMNEFSLSPARSNLRGTLAMAKVGGNANSATNQYFFNLTNNSANLDTQNGGFTVFAQVLDDGMSYIDYVSEVGTRNLNPDNATFNSSGVQTGANPDGARDPGAYTDVPVYGGGGNSLLIVDRAKVVTYWAGNSTTNVPATTFFNGEHFVEAGATFTGNGFLDVRPGARFALDHSANVNVKVINEGLFDPGLSIGAVSVARFSQAAIGTTKFELGGTLSGFEHDQINSSTAAILNGVLDVDLIDDFIPSPGNSFTLITGASVSGTFSGIDLPALPLGLVWGLHYNPANVVLTVAAADFNRNGVVDTADYTLWRDLVGTSVAAYSGADANGDGIVNNADFEVWKSNFGNRRASVVGTGTGAGSLALGAVPEPSSGVLLLLALFIASAVRRRVA